MSGSEGRHLRLSPFTLTGGDEYTVDLVVIDESAALNASSASSNSAVTVGAARLSMAEKGVVARLATKSVTVGAESAGLALDGSLSKDLDNRPGDIKVCVSM